LPEIILKDKSGTEQTYDYKKVSFRTPTEGEKAEFIFPNFAELEVTENGEYSVPEGVDGYTKVKANVPVPTLISGAEFELDFSDGDINIAAPDGYAFTGGTIKKPENLVPENIAKDVEIAGIVGTHEGGGAVEGTATVTFCNYDGTELFSRLVFVGDNCPDPIAQGKINEPTRESSAQYTYTYNGWSLTAGGTASASALNVVTGDRTVYAAYTQNVRYYTARFYDGTTLMKEEQVAYGSKATEPLTAKDGYNFIGWTPSDLTIYADTDFYGTWEESTYASLMGAPDVAPTTAVVGNAFFGDDTRLFVAAINQYHVYDVTGDTPIRKTTFDAMEGIVRDADISADRKVIVAPEYVRSNYASYTKFAFKVYSDNSISQAMSDYFGSTSKYPSGFYNWQTCRFNRDGGRLLISASGGTYIYDCSTTPFTLLKTLGSAYKYAVWGAGNDTLYYVRKVSTNSGALAKYTISTETSEDITTVQTVWNASRLTINSDYTRIAVVLSKKDSNSDVDTVTIFDAQTGQQVTTIALKTKINVGTTNYGGFGYYGNISYSPDGKTLAVACKDNVYFYDATDDKYTLIDSKHQGYDGGYAYSVNYNSSGNMVAVGSNVAPYVYVYKIEA
jgi:hypothetical protein